MYFSSWFGVSLVSFDLLFHLMGLSEYSSLYSLTFSSSKSHSIRVTRFKSLGSKFFSVEFHNPLFGLFIYFVVRDAFILRMALFSHSLSSAVSVQQNASYLLYPGASRNVPTLLSFKSGTVNLFFLSFQMSVISLEVV